MLGLDLRRVVKMKTNIEFDNEVVDKDNKVKYFQSGGKYLFRNRIYAKGGDIDKVEEITYIVHPSFPSPVRRVRNRESDFELIIWAWGEFTIKIIITTKDGEEDYRDFDFRFGDKVRDARGNKDIKFEEVEKKSS